LKRWLVIPAKAGIHWVLAVYLWMPAFAGMTIITLEVCQAHYSVKSPKKQKTKNGIREGSFAGPFFVLGGVEEVTNVM